MGFNKVSTQFVKNGIHRTGWKMYGKCVKLQSTVTNSYILLVCKYCSIGNYISSKHSICITIKYQLVTEDCNTANFLYSGLYKLCTYRQIISFRRSTIYHYQKLTMFYWSNIFALWINSFVLKFSKAVFTGRWNQPTS